tara:strand:+ start:1155 stop:1523 length:369 start_codon:yes stop_codon:yes gene_type:complete
MSTRSRKKQTEAAETPKGPIVAKGPALDIPARPVRSLDAPQNVRRPARDRALSAKQAGARSTLTPGAGEAFAAFCREQGHDPAQRRAPAFYDDLLTEFAERPIHGHRRRGGGTHKRNRADIR